MEQTARAALRIRGEGRLEVLEHATQAYQTLAGAVLAGRVEALSRADLAALNARCEDAQAELARIDPLELEAFAAALEASRTALHEALRTQAQALRLSPEGTIEVLADRLRAELPVRLRTEVWEVDRARPIGNWLRAMRMPVASGLGLGTVAIGVQLLMLGLGPAVMWELLLGGAATTAFLGTADSTWLARAILTWNSRRALLVISKHQLSLGSRTWPLSQLSFARLSPGPLLRLRLQLEGGPELELLGTGELEAVAGILSEQRVPLERQASPDSAEELLMDPTDPRRALLRRR